MTNPEPKTRAMERNRAKASDAALIEIVGADCAAILRDLYELLHGGLDPPATKPKVLRGKLNTERGQRQSSMPGEPPRKLRRMFWLICAATAVCSPCR